MTDIEEEKNWQWSHTSSTRRHNEFWEDSRDHRHSGCMVGLQWKWGRKELLKTPITRCVIKQTSSPYGYKAVKSDHRIGKPEMLELPMGSTVQARAIPSISSHMDSHLAESSICLLAGADD